MVLGGLTYKHIQQSDNQFQYINNLIVWYSTTVSDQAVARMISGLFEYTLSHQEISRQIQDICYGICYNKAKNVNSGDLKPLDYLVNNTTFT